MRAKAAEMRASGVDGSGDRATAVDDGDGGAGREAGVDAGGGGVGTVVLGSGSTGVTTGGPSVGPGQAEDW